MQNLFFHEAGDGFPVIFIHGFCESSSIWNALSNDLSDEFHVICPDLPGFGQSELPDNDFSLEDIGDIVVRWLKDKGINECIVIGHSLGGYISLEILRKYPDFVKGIGLFNSSAFEDPSDKKENRNKLIEFIGNSGVSPFLKTFVPSLFYPRTAIKHQKTIDNIEKEGLSIGPQSVMKYAAAMRDRAGSIDLLQKRKDRILLIAGEYDQNVPLEKSLEMAALLENENVHIVKESAHMSVFEQSELCYKVIREFVNKLIK